MIVNTSAQRNKFDQFKSSWDLLSPTFPDQNNVDGQGSTAEEISTLFAEIESLFNSFSTLEINQSFWNVKVPLIDSFLTTVSGYLPNPPNAVTFYTTANLFNIYHPLYSIRDLLLSLIPAAPLTRNQIRTAQSKVGEVESLLNQVKGLKGEVDELRDQSEAKVHEIETIKGSVDSQLTAIELISTDSVAAAAEIEVSRAEIEAVRIEAKTSSEEIAPLVTELQGAITSKVALFKEFEDMRESVHELLGYANQIALANSFMKARKRTRVPQVAWAVVFVATLIAAGVFSFLAYQNLIKLNTPISTSEFLSKLGFLTPFLIVAYFASRQFSFLSRISADYSFKEATALAYEGYRNEVATDEELLKLLQTGAITHFGENPMHMLLKNDDSKSLTEETGKQIIGWLRKVGQLPKGL